MKLSLLLQIMAIESCFAIVSPHLKAQQAPTERIGCTTLSIAAVRNAAPDEGGWKLSGLQLYNRSSDTLHIKSSPISVDGDMLKCGGSFEGSPFVITKPLDKSRFTACSLSASAPGGFVCVLKPKAGKDSGVQVTEDPATPVAAPAK